MINKSQIRDSEIIHLGSQTLLLFKIRDYRGEIRRLANLLIVDV